MESLQNAHDSATGTDEMHYQILKRLPNNSLNILLEIFIVIWKRRIFPKCWTEAIVIPIPKPNKGKRKVQGVPQSQAAALPRHKVKRKRKPTNPNKHKSKNMV